MTFEQTQRFHHILLSVLFSLEELAKEGLIAAPKCQLSEKGRAHAQALCDSGFMPSVTETEFCISWMKRTGKL